MRQALIRGVIRPSLTRSLPLPNYEAMGRTRPFVAPRGPSSQTRTQSWSNLPRRALSPILTRMKRSKGFPAQYRGARFLGVVVGMTKAIVGLSADAVLFAANIAIPIG